VEDKNMMLAESRNGNTEAVKQLLEAGADVNATNGEDASVLSYACELKDEAKRLDHLTK